MADVDLFVIAGQSNAQGVGDSALSPSVPAGQAYEADDAAVTHLADPVGGANTGSAWPAFAIAYYAATGRVSAYVECATGGTALLAANDSGNGDWSETGTLLDAAIADTQAAVAALIDAGHTPTLRGVLWHQGERDGNAADRTGYQDALEALPGRFQTALGVEGLPLFVFRLGARNSGDTPGFQEIRAAQDAAAAARADIAIVYRRCVEFPELGWMVDDLHYTQDGYNDMGTVGGATVARLTGLAGGRLLDFTRMRLAGGRRPTAAFLGDRRIH